MPSPTAVAVALTALITQVLALLWSPIAMSQQFFPPSLAALMLAIDGDDGGEVRKAVEGGVGVDTPGQSSMTPLMYAVLKQKPTAVAALLDKGADPNRKSGNGETALTLAARTAGKNHTILRTLLASRADPNTLRPDGDPVLVTLIANFDLEGIRLLAQHGANLDALSRTKKPLIVGAAQTGAWDVVWTLIDLGANYRASRSFPGGQSDVSGQLSNPSTLPDSPLWPYKVKVWQFLKEKGVPNVPAELPTKAPAPRAR